MDKTDFAGLTRLAPGDSLSEDGFSFQSVNPTIIDYLLRLAVQAHKHDGHAALANPSLDPVVATLDSGGTIPSDLSITVAYTLLDALGGETAPNSTPQVAATQAGMEAPGDAPGLTADTAAGTLLAANYAYAVTVTDGAGGETSLGPTVSIDIPAGSGTNEIVISGLNAIVSAVGGTGWRLWRSVNGGEWALINDGASDSITDDGSLCADCNVAPPDDTTGTTNSTNRLQVTVPAGQPAEAVQFRIYASVDGTFSSPSLLGTYPIADAGTVKTYSSLALLDGEPPEQTLAMPGAAQVDALTDIIHLTEALTDLGYTTGGGGGGGGGGGSVDPITKLDGGSLYSSPYFGQLHYWTDVQGHVHLEGYATNGSAPLARGDVLLTLPAGFRPVAGRQSIFAVPIWDGAEEDPGHADKVGSISISPYDGTVVLRWDGGYSSGNGTIQFDGIIFQPDPLP